MRSISGCQIGCGIDAASRAKKYSESSPVTFLADCDASRNEAETASRRGQTERVVASNHIVVVELKSVGKPGDDFSILHAN